MGFDIATEASRLAAQDLDIPKPLQVVASSPAKSVQTAPITAPDGPLSEPKQHLIVPTSNLMPDISRANKFWELCVAAGLLVIVYGALRCALPSAAYFCLRD